MPCNSIRFQASAHCKIVQENRPEDIDGGLPMGLAANAGTKARPRGGNLGWLYVATDLEHQSARQNSFLAPGWGSLVSIYTFHLGSSSQRGCIKKLRKEKTGSESDP